MTDNEIVKALEVHGNEKFDNCEGCPYLDGDSCEGFPKYSKPYRDVLDLINRQKAEIERLKAEAQMADGYADALKEQAKSEAYREFAERLKAKADRGFWQEHSYVDTEDIDNTLKELTESK